MKMRKKMIEAVQIVGIWYDDEVVVVVILCLSCVMESKALKNMKQNKTKSGI